MRSALLSLSLGLVLSSAAVAADRPTVVELFTSEGCSSCPPADALLTELARGRKDVLPLAFHVTYWDDLGWRDPFSLAAATERQGGYARELGAGVFTPQMVVEGRTSVIGSRRGDVSAAIGQARASAGPGVPLSLDRLAEGALLDVGAGTGAGRLLLIGLDRQRVTAVGRGENGGRTLTESNIVRSLQTVASWDGTALRRTVALPAGEDAAAILQSPDGRILGAARLGGTK